MTPHAYNAPMIGIPMKLPTVPIVEIIANNLPAKAVSTCDARNVRKVTVVLEPRTTTARPMARVGILGAKAMTKEPTADSVALRRESVRSLAEAVRFRVVVK